MSRNSEKLAVLMPVFNGGKYLVDSLASCAEAGLPGSEYELIVVDNCSTDGATTGLRSRDSGGAAVQVHRNASNIGRIGNWNRCLEIALAQGFRYVTFLFAGDRWIPGGSIATLFSVIRRSHLAIGFSPFTIADENGRMERLSQRFYVSSGATVVTTPRRFLATLLGSGLFPLGPLQANIYHVSPDHCIHFDESAPTVTDVTATLDFVHHSAGSIGIASKPFLQWRNFPGRFHSSMGAAQTIRDYFDTFHMACELTGIPVDYRRAKTRLIVNSARLITREAPAYAWPGLVLGLLRQSRLSPHRGSALYFLEALWLRFAMGRRLLEVS